MDISGFEKQDDFSGLVIFRNLDGSFNAGYRYDCGALTGQLFTNEDDQADITLKSKTMVEVCVTTKVTTYIDYWQNDEYVGTYNAGSSYETDCYFAWYDDGATSTTGSPGMGDPIDITIDCFCEPCPVCTKCKEDNLKSLDLSGDPGSESGDIDDAPGYLCPVCACPTVEDDELFSDPKMKCVYEKLLSTDILKNLVSEFVGSEKYNLVYEIVSSLTPINGVQAYGSCHTENGSSIITINSYYFDKASPVFLAKTVLHETIHANIRQKVNTIGGTENLSFDNFEDLYVYFLLRNGHVEYEHDVIQNDYLPRLAEALKQFDGNKYSLDYYEAISWSGLYNTLAWNKLSEEEKTEILRKIEKINSGDLDCEN